MSTAAVVGLGAGNRLLISSYYYSESLDKLSGITDYGLAIPNPKKNIIAAKNNKSSPNNSFISSRHDHPTVRALKEQHVDTSIVSDPSDAADIWVHRFMQSDVVEELTVEAILVLQKSMLEKQWNLSPETILTNDRVKEIDRQIQHTGPKRSARRRRIDKRRLMNQNSSTTQPSEIKHLRYNINPDLLQNRKKGYMKGLTSEQLLTHSEVVELSKQLKPHISPFLLSLVQLFMASSEAASDPSVEEVTSEETEIAPTVEEALSPIDPKYNETEGTILSDEDGKEFDEEDEKTDALSPTNQDPEPSVSFEGSGFTEFTEEGEDKENVDDEEDDDN